RSSRLLFGQRGGNCGEPAPPYGNSSHLGEMGDTSVRPHAAPVTYSSRNVFASASVYPRRTSSVSASSRVHGAPVAGFVTGLRYAFFTCAAVNCFRTRSRSPRHKVRI